MISLAAGAGKAAGKGASDILAGVAGPVGGFVAGTVPMLIGQGRNAANLFVQGLQNKLQREVLAPAATLAQTDPQAAQVMVQQGWQDFLSKADQYARMGGNQAKVVRQSLTTPNFINSVKAGLGGQDPFDSAYTQNFLGGALGKVGGAVTSGLGKILTAIIPGIAAAKSTPPYNPNGNTGEGGVLVDNGVGATPGAKGGTTGGNTANSSSPLDAILKTLGPVIPGLIGSILQSRAVGNASNAQIGAQNHAADLQYQSSQQALDFLKQMFAQQQGNQQPWLDAGKQSLTTLQQLMAPGGDLAKQFTEQFNPTAPYAPKQFTPPTIDDLRADPGIAFGLAEGTKAIQRAAAAHANLLSGATAKALERFSIDYGDTKYGDVFNRGLTTSQENNARDVTGNQLAYNRAASEYGTRRDVFNQNQGNAFNRYASIAGLGQTAAGQDSTNAGNLGTNVAGLLTTQGNNSANTATNIGNVTAASSTAQGNVWSNFLSQLGNRLNGGVTLQDLINMSKGVTAG